MDCTACGKDNPDSAQFCGWCGASYSVSTPEEEGQLVLLEMNIAEDEIGMKAIVGLVGNDSQAALTAVSITFDIFDKEGYKLDEAADFIERLGPGEKWKFKAYISEDEMETAKLIELSGYHE